MDRIDFSLLIAKRDKLSQAEIEKTSKQLLQVLQIEDSTFDLLNKVLYADSFSAKAEMASVMKAIRGLKMRQEMLELLQSEDIVEAIKNLNETAQRFGKKAQSSVGN